MLEIYNIEKIDLHTLDNPGWSLKIKLALEKDNLIIRRNIINESDWYFVSVEDSVLNVAGDDKKLLRCLRDALDYFDQPVTAELESYFPYLDFLQRWYSWQCDEDWEHTYGLRLTVDSDGYCQCYIDLLGTWGYLDEQKFETIGDVNTFICWKVEDRFIGEGHVCHLINYLKAFKDWLDVLGVSAGIPGQ